MNNISTLPQQGPRKTKLDQVESPEKRLEEMLFMREGLLAKQEEIEAHLEVLKDEIVRTLEEEKVSGKVVGNQSISIVTSYTTSKETAKSLGLIKTITQERIDTTGVKSLVMQGVTVPNLVVTKTPRITQIVKGGE